MNYIVEIHESDDPNGVRFWASVHGLEGCGLAEETLDELYRNAPGIIKDVIETSNERGANIPAPTGFEFRLLLPA